MVTPEKPAAPVPNRTETLAVVWLAVATSKWLSLLKSPATSDFEPVDMVKKVGVPKVPGVTLLPRKRLKPLLAVTTKSKKESSLKSPISTSLGPALGV